MPTQGSPARRAALSTVDALAPRQRRQGSLCGYFCWLWHWLKCLGLVARCLDQPRGSETGLAFSFLLLTPFSTAKHTIAPGDIRMRHPATAHACIPKARSILCSTPAGLRSNRHQGVSDTLGGGNLASRATTPLPICCGGGGWGPSITFIPVHIAFRAVTSTLTGFRAKSMEFGHAGP